ncbi:MAG: tRNA pseudouridine(55) synthase TruB [Polyangiaceae bacterium]|nr:tRNA pseudouridine(55) synthase TruB [Polyangiaceae bacterium]
MADDDSLPEALEGVLVVDKPTGPTSHDVVGKLRRTLRMRRIGHAGTLDPLASGVLVVLLGQATKLGPYLTLHDKRYDARVVFGRSTDTLDTQGTITSETPLPEWLLQEIEQLASGAPIDAAPRLAEAVAHERARKAQTPPAYSAIKVAGQRSYDRARRGEAVTLEDRPVEVTSIELRGAGFVEQNRLGFVDISLDVSKGYYVRSFARDLGQTLGVPSCLGALRRTRSGPFDLQESVSLDAARSMLEASVIPLAKAAARCMSTSVLTASGVTRAIQGKLLSAQDFSVPPAISDEPSAWMSPEGDLVAVGGVQADAYVVRRGFTANRTATTDASRV